VDRSAAGAAVGVAGTKKSLTMHRTAHSGCDHWPSSTQSGWSQTRNTLSKSKWGSTRKPNRNRKFFFPERYFSALPLSCLIFNFD
jgi:hypothetical protein